MRRAPRRALRGLGLVEAMLAAGLLAAAAAWAAQALGGLADRELLAREARAVSASASAARLWAEADLAGRAPSGSAPVPVTFAQLQADGLWGAAAPDTTPGRGREMRIWLWRRSAGLAMVFVRARGDPADLPPGTPGAADSAAATGVIPDVAGATEIRGPDLLFDTAAVTDAPAGWARRGDLFAVESVLTPHACPDTLYLHREALAGCPDANTMAADFTVTGDFSAEGALDVEGDAAVEGAADVAGGLTVGGALGVTGDLAVTGGLEARAESEASITAGGAVRSVCGP